MDTTKCEALVKSVDLGSFTAAAQALGYTPSGITRIVDSLESELGITLVNRNRKGITCTREGDALMPLMRDAARCGSALTQAAAELRDVITGEIVVGTYYSTAACWLPHILSAFQEAHPKVRVRIIEGGNKDLAEWVEQGKADCAFCSQRHWNGDFIPLRADELVAWVPSSWPEAQMKTFPLQKFDGMPFILQLPGTNTEIEEMLEEHNVKPKVLFTANDGYAAWSMVSAGLGASINNRLMSSLWKGNVAVLSLRPSYMEGLGIILNSIERASPATRKFVEFSQRIVATL